MHDQIECALLLLQAIDASLMDRVRGSHRSSAENIEKRGNMDKLDEDKGGLFLANPNACEEDSPKSTNKKLSTSNSLIAGDSKERLFVKGKSRSKSPSFFRMLVGGLRKLSTHELEDTEDRHTTGESSSFSDTDEPVSQKNIWVDSGVFFLKCLWFRVVLQANNIIFPYWQ